MKRVSILFLSLMFIFGACSGAQPVATGVDAAEPPATQAPATEVPVIPDTGSNVLHTVIPVSLPAEKFNHAGDQDSFPMADKKRAPSGDRFTFDRFERTFNANTMDQYFGNLDIQDFTVFVDDTFVYSSVILHSLAAADSPKPGRYALEIDLDVDGDGDLLVIAGLPGSTDWTTDGVEVWFDENDDVGGEKVLVSDSAPAGDGYETKAFGGGEGNDPDTAWVRISPDDPNTIQFAVKLSLFNGDTGFLVGAWAGTESLNPALFDLNDHFTHEQAGEAMVDFEIYYPIKELAELDNTCRLNVGFTATGAEPGLCPVPGGPDSHNVPGCSISCGYCQVPSSTSCSCVPDPSPQCSG